MKYTPKQLARATEAVDGVLIGFDVWGHSEDIAQTALEAAHEDEPKVRFAESVYVYTSSANDPDQVGKSLSYGYFTTLEDCVEDNIYRNTDNTIDDIARVTVEHLDMTEIRRALQPIDA